MNQCFGQNKNNINSTTDETPTDTEEPIQNYNVVMESDDVVPVTNSTINDSNRFWNDTKAGQSMKKLLYNSIELFKSILFFIICMAIWFYVPWLGTILLIIISPVILYEVYKFFKELHQSNLDDIREQLNIVQDTWIEDISNEVRDNWDLKSTKVVPYDRWNCRIYIQQDEDGNV